jgi:hypothetical protein
MSRELPGLASAFALSCALAACAEPSTDENTSENETLPVLAIISNAKAPEETINRLGLVQVEYWAGYCSAVLIGTRTALTARHCDADVGTEVGFRGEIYTATETREPPSEFDIGGVPRDLEILVLDRDVVFPGTSTPWAPELGVWQFDPSLQIGAKLLCFGAGPNEVINGSPGGNSQSDFYGAVRTIAGVEDNATYRIVPGLEHGDSGGPCFAPIWHDNQYKYALMSINSTSTRGSNQDHSDTPGIDAAAVSTGEASINAWINSNTQ